MPARELQLRSSPTTCTSKASSGILLLLALILISGCGRKDRSTLFYRQMPVLKIRSWNPALSRLGLRPTTRNFGTITVPENREKASSRLISIPFLRIHSHAKAAAEPIFAFSGGPGQSNMSWDWSTVGGLLAEHDFVAVGYRGVDGSSVLDCPEVTEAFKAHGDPLSERSLEAIGHAWEASAQRFRAQGVDLDGYTMLECIEDNESVRRALGYGRINLLSASYGTRVAYLYGLKTSGPCFPFGHDRRESSRAFCLGARDCRCTTAALCNSLVPGFRPVSQEPRHLCHDAVGLDDNAAPVALFPDRSRKSAGGDICASVPSQDGGHGL